MKKLFTPIIALCLPVAALIAQPIPAQRQGEKVTMRTHSNSPSFINLAPEVYAPQAEFQSWIQPRLGMKQNDNLVLYKTEKPDELGYTLYRYNQTYKGIPVLDGMYYSHVKNGQITCVNGAFFGGLSLDVTPTLTEAQALDKALQHIGASEYMWQDKNREAIIKKEFNNPSFTYYPKGTLAIAPIKGNHVNGDYRLCYMFDVYAKQPLSKEDIYIDAKTGEVVNEINRLYFSDAVGTAHTRYSGTQPITTDMVSSSSYRLRESGRGNGIATYNCQNAKNQVNTDFTDSDNDWNNVNADHDEVATDAHWGAEMVYDYYKKVHNRNSIDDNGYKLLSYVHYDQNYNNAFWDGQEMTYGDGDGSRFTPLTAIDVCGHEITHGLVSNTAQLNSQEGGALNEGFADIFGTSIEFYARPNKADWLMGVDISPTGTALRSLANPKSVQGGDPDTYMGTYWDPQGEVHNNAGPIDHWYYLLSMGGSGTNDNGDAFNVIGITIKEAEKIAFRALTVYMSSGTDYADTRTCAIKAADDLFGTCTPQEIATTNAFYAIGVGAKSTCTNVNVETNSLTDNSFEIYPNPSSNLITINKFAFAEKSISVEISNMIGEKIYSSVIESTGGMFKSNIDISAYKSGVYFVSLKNGNSVITRKLVKQ